MVKKKINEIAHLLDGKVIGDGDIVIERIRSLEEAGEGDLTFLANPQYRKFIQDTGASAILVDSETACEGKNLIVVANPYIAFGKVLTLYYPETIGQHGISPQAFIEDGALIAPDVII